MPGKEVPVRESYKLMRLIFTTDDSRFAAEIVQLKPNHWSDVKHGRGRIPQRSLQLLLNRLNRDFPGIDFAERHLDLGTEEFVQLFQETSIFEKLKNYTSVKSDDDVIPLASSFVETLIGKFVGLYLCKDPADREVKTAVAVDGFEISSPDPGGRHAKLTQHSQFFGANRPEGTVRVKHDTVEMNINYLEPSDPRGTYMAGYPKERPARSILAISVDTADSSRVVVARPTIFLRVDELPRESILFTDETEIYSCVVEAFKNHVRYDPVKMALKPDHWLSEQITTKLSEAWRRYSTGASHP